MLTITLFGGFAVTLDDKPLTSFPTDATRALLAFLALNAGRPQTRLALAALFWPDLAQDMALQNVRTTLYRLRRVLGEKTRDIPFILTDRRAIQFNPDSAYDLDAARFTALHRAIQHDKAWLPPERIQQMETAVALSHPHFIPELAVNSNVFEAWREAQEQRYRRQAFWLLDQLVGTAVTNSDFAAMSRYARQQIDLAPYNETGHQNQMRALASLGRRQEAIAHYHAFCQSMETDPSPALVALYQQIDTGLTPLPTDNPYRGLNAFHEENAPDFYGREAVVTLLKEMLAERPLAALIGPSGSGKTSVACAGACAQLRREGWHILRLRPGAQPWQTLAEAIASQFAAAAAVTPEMLANGRYPAAELIETLRNAHEGLRPFRLLIVVDQFEQLYTLLPDEEQRHAFIDWLLAASGATAVVTGAHLLLTMRADFMNQALAYRPLADALQPGILPIGPMTRSELRRAIIYPATNRRVTFQDGLVKRILDDLVAAPGQLPLLQFTLTRLWEEREENWLTHRAYEANGSVGGALSFHAQTVYNQLNETEQQLARHIFLRLVQSRQGVADTSRPTARADLPQAAWPLVQRLADARLIVTGYDGSGRELAALAHEALISNWPQLRDWLNEDRAFHLWRQRLDTACHQWQENNQDAGALLRGRLLSEAENWLTARAADLSPSAAAYIQASLRARHARQQAIESQRQQELAQAQSLAEAEGQRATIAAQSRQRLRWFVIGLTVMLLIATLSAVAAIQQRQETQQAAAVSQSLNLTTNAQLALSEGSTNLALMLAAEANHLPDPPLSAQRMLAEAAYAPGTRRVFMGHDGPVEDVAVAPGGWERALSAAADGTLILWDLQKGASIRRFSGHDDAALGVAFLPQGDRALSASADGSLILWDVETGAMVRRFIGHESVVWDVVVAPDCDLAQSACRAISGDENGDLILWDVATGDIIQRLSEHSGAVYTVAISPDGRTALSGSADGSLILWKLATGDLIYRLQGQHTAENVAGEDVEAPNAEGHRGPVRDVVFGGDGRTAYSVGDDLRIIHWDLKTGIPLRADAFNAGLYSVDLSADGRNILLGRSDSQMVLWSPFYGQVVLELLGHTSRIQAVVFSPDGRQALSASADGTMRLWDLRSGAEMRSMIINGSALDVALSPDGKNILLAGATGDLPLLDYDSGAEIRRLVGHTETPFAGVLFRPSTGKDAPLMAVSGGGDVFGVAADNTLRLWNVETGEEIRRFEGHTDRLWDVDVSGDGRFAVSASHDGTVRLWDLDQGDGQILADVSPQVPRSVAISPDGNTILLGLAKGTSAAPDFNLRLLDAQTGETLRTFSGHTEIVSDVAFSPDGNTALSGSHDKLLILWDVATGQELRRFAGHTGAVNQVRFSPATANEEGGRLALSAGLDNLIILWDVATGEALRVYRGHVGGVMSAAFAPDGKSLFSVALDDTVREWRIDADLPDLLGWMEGNRFAAEPTCEERAHYLIRPLCVGDE